MSESRNSVTTRLFILIQYLVPHHWLSRLTGMLATSTTPWLKNLLIRRFIAAFGVNMSEAQRERPEEYRHFNDFFTRSLKHGARPISEDDGAIVSPADGAVSQIGPIEVGCLLQAKGHSYRAADLLGDQNMAKQFHGGAFATIYLSPRDYHRVHMPLGGTLIETRYIPGRLFSVNQATAENVPELFALNERLVCLFETEHGPMAMVLVGAMIVAGIETVWSGQVAPAGQAPQVARFGDRAENIKLSKGDEMGRFQLGSTVILLFPPDTVAWTDELVQGSSLRMGQTIASLS